MKIVWGYDLTGYDKEDEGYILKESQESVKPALNRLQDVKETNEYVNYFLNLPKERRQLCLDIFQANLNMTEEQHAVWYARINQEFSFTAIGDLRGYTPQGARNHFNLASKKLQKIRKSNQEK